MAEVIVIGSGLQGVCAALSLHAVGHDVRIVEQAPRPMTRASLRNEGKIHLGFTYANEASMRTAELCLATGVRFADLIDGWLPQPIDWTDLRSRPFTYLIMADSLLGPELIGPVYEKLADQYEALGRPHYLGAAIDTFVTEVGVPDFVSRDRVVAAFRTAEAALDLPAFRLALTAGLSGRVDWRLGRRVDGVSRRAGGFEVSGTFDDGTRWSERADAVVNCSWEGRAALDKQVGLLPESPLSYRLKYRVLARLPAELEHLPALTMALGPYGDVVPGTPGYFSWYPVCRAGWSEGVAPPRDWQHRLKGAADAPEAASISDATLSALDEVVPGVGASTVVGVDAGVVVATGSTDIDDAASPLHSRSQAGVFGGDGYLSIDTGKLGFAPHFAAELPGLL